MSQPQPQIAFRSSDHLHQTTDGYIRRMARADARPEPDTLETIMEVFVDESLSAFFLQPTELVGLSPRMQRVIRVAADTISKATGMVVKRAARKLALPQHKDAADYMEQMRVMVPGSEGEERWYVAFPVPEALAGQLERARDQAEGGDTVRAAATLAAALHEITDIALHWYLAEPVRLLRFGPIMKKMAHVAMETTRKATHGVIRRVFADMEGEQVVLSTRYMAAMVLRPEA
ncbi:hypothetical protein [Isoalcanivorax indicus]|uniref:hypothetical protein n=1 Tax=Isoalcanivorax indicus TaxID=2202653 RepID=UPI000DBA4CBF|nr:hypothetical protein [Isoalcanivorax indicus]